MLTVEGARTLRVLVVTIVGVLLDSAPAESEHP